MFFPEILGAVEVLACKVELGLGGPKLGLLLTGVELDQELSVGGVGAGLEADGRDDAGEIGAQHDPLGRGEGAHRLQHR